MRQAIRLFVLLEGAAFIAAALTHFGVLISGYEHQRAGTAESVIGIVLLVGWGLTWIRPGLPAPSASRFRPSRCLGPWSGSSRSSGVGPRTGPDVAYHIVIVLALLSGLVVAGRAASPRV